MGVHRQQCSVFTVQGRSLKLFDYLNRASNPYLSLYRKVLCNETELQILLFKCYVINFLFRPFFPPVMKQTAEVVTFCSRALLHKTSGKKRPKRPDFNVFWPFLARLPKWQPTQLQHRERHGEQCLGHLPPQNHHSEVLRCQEIPILLKSAHSRGLLKNGRKERSKQKVYNITFKKQYMKLNFITYHFSVKAKVRVRDAVYVIEQFK